MSLNDAYVWKLRGMHGYKMSVIKKTYDIDVIDDHLEFSKYK